jgi:Tol biopolymer transport system component
VLGSVLAGVTVWRFSRTDDRPARAVTFVVAPPDNTSFSPSLGFLALSPDGRSLAFVASSREGANYALWIRSLDSLATRQLAGTDGGVQPFWSADSRFLAFNNTADHRLKKIDASSGLVQTVSDVPSGQVGAWNRAGVILRPYQGVLYRHPVDGGPAVPATALDRSRDETGHVWPQFLPDDRHFLYLARSTQPRYDGMLYVASLDSPKPTAVLKTDSYAEYAPPGYLLFVKGSTLVAQPFDARSFRASGEPVPIAEQVERNQGNLRGAFSVSRTGVLAYRQIGDTQLVWFDRMGRASGSVGARGRYTNPALSPDQQRVAVSRGDAATGTRDIWTIELPRGIASRLTADGMANQPVWSPDGSRLAYLTREGFAQRASNGSGSAALIQSAPSGDLLDWSPDGRALVYESPFTPRTAFDIWMLPLVGDRKPVPLVQGDFFDVQGQVSPDGRWLAYASDESGRFEVSVQPFPSGQGRWRISANGGLEPHWRRDGKELFFLALDRTLMAVPVGTGSTFEMDMPKPLFETRMSTLWNYTRNQYAVAADGQRFLINQPAGQASPITVLVNWTVALKK